jgi:DNA-binding transcriptional MerR regulator
MDDRLHIGAVAARAGVNIQTLRYYERRGLFDTPQRSPSGYRQYRPETVQLVRAVKRAQQLGFRLAEIEDLFRLQEARAPAAKVRSLADAKLREIDEKIRALRTMRRALQRLVDTCACGGDLSRCRVLDGLGNEPRRGTRSRRRGKP